MNTRKGREWLPGRIISVQFDFNKYKRVAVIGAARSGIAAAKLLNKNGINVLLSDSNPKDRISSVYLKEIADSGISAEFGFHSDDVYKRDLVVVSPGVPQSSEVIRTALGRGIELISEVELASWFCKGKIISITGTNGKTTTTTLTGEICRAAGIKTFVCGNIGSAFSDATEKIPEDGIAVVETSSFQLDNIKYFKPLIAVILNITPDHLDRYNKSIDEYASSKQRIYENQDAGDYIIYNNDDNLLKKSMKKNIRSSPAPFSISKEVKKEAETGAYLDNCDLIFFYHQGEEIILDTQKLIIKGIHNAYNAMASAVSARLLGIDKSVIQKTLESFKGVEHRLEFVRELRGVKYYNDSKATNINSVWYALQGFNEQIVLILGGRDKGNDYKDIENEVKKYVKQIIAIGESRQKIYDFFEGKVPVTLSATMKEAVEKAAIAAQENEVVLLSPACASFDMYDNYEQRGADFKMIVNSL